MKEYISIVKRVINEGMWVATGARGVDGEYINALTLFGINFEHDMRNGFPLLTTKRVWMKGVAEELKWMLRGEHNVGSLNEKGVHIWDAWADENGEVGPIYGKQWRDFGGVDQVMEVISGIRKVQRDSHDRARRRLVVSSWNPTELGMMRLEPCHVLWQIGIVGSCLHMGMYQRSCDLFLGVPFNIASYALLLKVIGGVVGMDVGRLCIMFGDTHIYANHLEIIKKQIDRECLELPEIDVNVRNVTDWDYNVLRYINWGQMKGEISI